jgi:hypothetical protein
MPEAPSERCGNAISSGWRHTRAAAGDDYVAVERDAARAGEEGDNRRHLVGRDEPPDRHARLEPALELVDGRPACLCHRRHRRRRGLGARHPRVYDGDVDAPAAELVGEVLRHRCDGDVAHGADDRPCLPRCQAADVDDPPPPTLSHLRRERAGAAEVPPHLHVDLALEVVVGERRARGRRRRRVDEDVHPAELLDDARRHRTNGGVVARVGRRPDHTASACVGYLLRRPPERLLAARHERDVRPLLSERARDREPDPPTSPSDNGSPPGQLEIHGGHTTLGA